MTPINDNISKRETRRINEIKIEYLSKGYKVLVNPTKNELPTFLRGFTPDLIATSEAENVVIEIKSKGTLKESKYLANIADIIKRQRNWRFELVVTNPRYSDKDRLDEAVLSLAEIEKRLDTIKKLLSDKVYDATFLIAWSVLEAALRIVALDHLDNRLAKQATLKLIKTLYSYGYLSKSELSLLERLHDVRNKLSHGFHVEKDYIKEMSGLLNLIDKYLEPSKHR